MRTDGESTEGPGWVHLVSKVLHVTSSSDGQADPIQVKVSGHPQVLVTITGPTEAAVMHRAGTWLEDFDGAVEIVSTNWRGDVSELLGRGDEVLYQLDLTVDMSIAVDEGRWPRDWFLAQ
jgi:hypothetical protein